MRRLLLLLLLLCYVQRLCAQQIIEASSVKDRLELAPYEQVLVEKAEVSDVLSGKLDDAFKDVNGTNLYADGAKYWLRFSIANNLATPQTFYIGTTKFDSIAFYFPDGRGGYTVQRGGICFPNKDKKLRYGHFSFADIMLQPGQSAKCYMYVTTGKAPFFQFVPLKPTLHTRDYFLRAYGNTLNYNLIFLGIVAIMALYNLFLLFITKSRAYLWYFCYNLSILGYVYALSGQATALLMPNAAYQESLVLFTGISALASYTLFAREILETARRFPRADKVLRIISIIAVLALIPSALGMHYIAIPVCFCIALAAYPLILSLAVRETLKKNVPARYFLIANSFYITLLMISILQMLGVLPTFIFGMQANVLVQIGVSLELALFSLSLGARIISIREKTLKESEERLSQFLEAMPVGVYVMDKDGNPHYTNEAANELLMQGHIEGSADTHSYFQKVYKAGTNEIYPLKEWPIYKALDGKTMSVEDMELRENGKVKSLQVTARPIYDEQHRIISSIAVFQDITQRIAARKQLEQYSQLLEQKVEERTHELVTEKKKSDDLLANILPKEVAEELKERGKTKARQFENVSILFTDFVNFTGISESLSPEALVAELDECFKAFDLIIEKNGLEKIKTIGDAYLAVAGLPVEDTQHAVKTTKAATEILQYMLGRQLAGRYVITDVRIGIHSGPVIAGIVGNKKFVYDIWGDSVNLASRMESASAPGKINISGRTYELLKGNFHCEYRGKIQAKNKGEVDMYWVA